MINTISSFFKSNTKSTAELEAESKRRLEEFKSEYNVLIETMCLRFAKNPTDFSSESYPSDLRRSNNGDTTLFYYKIFDLIFHVDKYCYKDKNGYINIDNGVYNHVIELFKYYLPNSHQYLIIHNYDYKRLCLSRPCRILTYYVRFDTSVQVTASKYEVDLEKKNRDVYGSKLINDEWENIVIACHKFCTEFGELTEKSELFVFDIDCGIYAIHDETGCDRIAAIVTDTIHQLVSKSLGTKTFKINNVIDKEGNIARCHCYGEKNI